VAVTVLVAWFTSLIVGAIEMDWTALTVTTPVMMLLAGYAFGIKIIQRQKPDPGPPPHAPLDLENGRTK
jgi:hydrogenase/urease accessory protein HupE